VGRGQQLAEVGPGAWPARQPGVRLDGGGARRAGTTAPAAPQLSSLRLIPCLLHQGIATGSEEYWSARKARQATDALTAFQRQVASDQKWVCPKCGDWILNGEEWHEHRVIPGGVGGKYTRDNVRLVHLFCHQAEHSGKKRAKEVE
jgi:HNH endonuclease